jgi:hypothetical protein
MLNLTVNKNVETEFRKTIGEARGIYRGNLRSAIEALFLWIQTYKKGGYGLGYTDAMSNLPSSSFLTNPKIRYCPTTKTAVIMTKMAIPGLVELNPPVIAEILTIDVSTIRVIVMTKIRIKMPLEPILYWNLFNNVMTPVSVY